MADFVERLQRLKEIGKRLRITLKGGGVMEGKIVAVYEDNIVVKRWTTPTTFRLDYVPVRSILYVTEIVEVKKKR